MHLMQMEDRFFSYLILKIQFIQIYANYLWYPRGVDVEKWKSAIKI